jgi:septum formation inhibitor-activating ATPase MinD
VAKIIVVTSGKGGVGKTTSSASFSSGLALLGYKTAVIDFDVGLRNLDLRLFFHLLSTTVFSLPSLQRLL